MSDPWQPLAREEAGSLDPASKLRIGRFLWRILLIAGFALMLHVGHERPLREVLGILALASSFGGMVSALVATARREPFAKGAFNGWDEMLVFVALSRLAHGAAHIQA